MRMIIGHAQRTVLVEQEHACSPMETTPTKELIDPDRGGDGARCYSRGLSRTLENLEEHNLLMPSKLGEDPRIKSVFAGWGVRALGDVASREDLLSIENSDTGKAAAAALKAFLDTCDDETIAPSAGLRVHTESVVSSPDSNKINVQFIRPDNGARVPCVYCIHGGGMYMLSCYEKNYQAWGKIIAANGVPWQWWIFGTRFPPLPFPK
jgi:hypothetical protein